MKKSLFRFTDVLELCAVYLICFLLDFLLDYMQTTTIYYWLLESFVEEIRDHRAVIYFLLTLIAVVFHYQLLLRKKTEIFCKVLVGDTPAKIAARYFLNCLAVLGAIFLLAAAADIALGFSQICNIYLFCIYLIYIILASMVLMRKHENF